MTPRIEFHCSPADGAQSRPASDWRRFISSFSTEVGFKVDDGKFTWLKWKVDGSEKVTMSPSADDTRLKLIDATVGGNELLVDVTPYSEGPVTVTFDLAEDSVTVSTRCGLPVSNGRQPWIECTKRVRRPPLPRSPAARA